MKLVARRFLHRLKSAIPAPWRCCTSYKGGSFLWLLLGALFTPAVSRLPGPGVGVGGLLSVSLVGPVRATPALAGPRHFALVPRLLGQLALLGVLGYPRLVACGDLVGVARRVGAVPLLAFGLVGRRAPALLFPIRQGELLTLRPVARALGLDGGGVSLRLARDTVGTVTVAAFVAAVLDLGVVKLRDRAQRVAWVLDARGGHFVGAIPAELDRRLPIVRNIRRRRLGLRGGRRGHVGGFMFLGAWHAILTQQVWGYCSTKQLAGRGRCSHAGSTRSSSSSVRFLGMHVASRTAQKQTANLPCTMWRPIVPQPSHGASPCPRRLVPFTSFASNERQVQAIADLLTVAKKRRHRKL